MVRRMLIAAGLVAFAAAAPALLAITPAASAAATQPGAEDQLVIVMVVDQITGQPLSGWDILIGPAGPYDFWYTGTTGNTGTARFLLPAGAYRAWATRGGSQVWGVTFSVAGDAVRVVVPVNPYED